MDEKVMAFLGHADSQVTLRIYAHTMAHEEAEREALRALVNGEALPEAAEVSAPFGTSTADELAQDVER